MIKSLLNYYCGFSEKATTRMIVSGSLTFLMVALIALITIFDIQESWTTVLAFLILSIANGMRIGTLMFPKGDYCRLIEKR